MEINELYKVISEGGISISKDTRTIKPGDIYIGIKGDVFDGNALVKEALDKGARLAIIDNAAYKIDDRCIVVENTTTTLQELAAIYRQSFSIPLLVIGGSNGKTTTKELISAVLATTYKVHATKGNLNNERGLPLTLLAMPLDTDIAVIEIAADHANEHTEKMKIVAPTHVLVTNNGADHLEGFGSIEGVRKANKEIFDCARLQKATAFVNKLLPDLMEDSAGMERILYPATTIESISGLQAGLIYEGTVIQSQLFGSFNEANIVAAIAVGKQFNIPIETIAKAIQVYEPGLKRSQIIRESDHILIVDCYNANPTSMELSLKDFFYTSEAGKRIVIVGDMLEVGETETAAHEAILQMIKEQSDAHDVVMCVGPRFSLHKNSFPFHFFSSSEQAKVFYTTLDLQGKSIFLKGSRGIKLETILANNSLQ